MQCSEWPSPWLVRFPRCVTPQRELHYDGWPTPPFPRDNILFARQFTCWSVWNVHMRRMPGTCLVCEASRGSAICSSCTVVPIQHHRHVVATLILSDAHWPGVSLCTHALICHSITSTEFFPQYSTNFLYCLPIYRTCYILPSVFKVSLLTNLSIHTINVFQALWAIHAVNYWRQEKIYYWL